MENPLHKPETAAPEGLEEIPLRFEIPPGMVSRYAHHMLVQGGENEVTLSFFELILPLLVGTPDEQMAIAKKGVKAECVARIVIAKSRYADFVRAMTVAMEKSKS